MKDKLKSPFFYGSILFIALIFFMPHIDTDFGWHLRYGEYFLDNWRFLKTNELTYFLPGYLWPNSYTLYQILITFIYKHLGFFVISLSYSVLMAITFVIYDLIYPKLSRTNLISFILVIFFGFSVFASGLRAQVFTFFFLILTLYLLKHKIKERLLPLIFFIIFIFWVNLHGGYILGLFLLFSAGIAALINREKDKYRVLGISLISAISASLINPYGLKIFQEDIRHMQVPMGTLIAEWVAPNTVYKLVIIALVLLIIYFLWKRNLKSKYFWSINLAGISYLAYTAKRNLPFFGLISILSIYEIFQKNLTRNEKNPTFHILTNIFLIAGIGMLLITNIPKTVKSFSNPNYICTEGLLPNPCKAVDFIKENNIPGQNVFSSYEWGGYLAWKLPEYKFFVDGRTPAWPTPEGKSPYTVYLEIIQAQKGYQSSLDKYKTDWMLVPANTFLDLELQKNNQNWKEIFRDEISVVYIKKI